MQSENPTPDDTLGDFTKRTIALEGADKTVYVAGSGPAVIVMPEMPGISPDVLRFARWVRDAGFTVWPTPNPAAPASARWACASPETSRSP
ncbi:hypothetical protein ACFXPS_04520 [Nocardia sp. NPDC059091]|uniref:hypothetical protein n=1 Tax=Nocardia sp. NPDC059091 TaxID=3346724 RepID=UPI0036BFA869